MSTHDQNLDFEFAQKYKTLCLIAIVVGGIAAAVGFGLNAKHTWGAILINNYYFVTLALSGVFFMALQYVAGARWADALRRLPEAMMSFLPIGALLMLVLYFGMHSLYHWSDPHALEHDALLRGKAAYLNTTSFFIRMSVILLIWIVFARLLRSASLTEDGHVSRKYYKRNTTISALFIIFFAFSFSLASVDWIMSVEPHWFSTMFGVYCFSGLFVSGVAAITLMTRLLQEDGYLTGINENHYHDLAKLLFAFSLFWAYIWFCQFMLIWYGNIPEETAYFYRRLMGDWDWLFYFNFIVNFVVPFLVLMPRASKRSPGLVKRVCILLLIGHWLDLYLLVMPGIAEGNVAIGVTDVLITLGYAGLFVFCTGLALTRGKLMPVGSPVLAESLHHHQ